MGVYFALRQHNSIKELTADLLITLVANMGGGGTQIVIPTFMVQQEKTYGMSMNIWRVSQHKQPAGICRDSCVLGWATAHSMM